MTSITVKVDARTVEGDDSSGLVVTEAPASSVVSGDELPNVTTRTVEVGADTETVTETTETVTLSGGHTIQYKELAGTQVQEEPMFR